MTTGWKPVLQSLSKAIMWVSCLMTHMTYYQNSNLSSGCKLRTTYTVLFSQLTFFCQLRILRFSALAASR